jgi:sodium-dependent dicarboxylate transporter 2/3/5
MEAGALALCAALEQSGAAAWGAHQAFTQLGGLTPWLVIAAVALATVILTELFSNPAVVTLLVPLLIASSAALGVTAIDLTLVVALACGLSFVLPLGSPPLAIAFASGEYTVRKAAGWGLLLDLLAVPVVVLVWWLCW